jgi:hypothetical protein
MPVGLPLAARVQITGSAGPVFTDLAGGVSHGYPQVRWSVQLATQDEGNASQFQEDCDGVGALPLKSVQCALVGYLTQCLPRLSRVSIFCGGLNLVELR